jgi:hypothetical protein
MSAPPSPTRPTEAHEAAVAEARAWLEVLDRLETDAQALEDALEAGDVLPVQTWVPPRDLGPLPEVLRVRAEGTLRRLDDARGRARGRLAGLTGDLDDLDRRRRAGAAYGTEVMPTA